MKPCLKNRQRLAWLALDSLDDRNAKDLRRHLLKCESCRQYLEEISTVAKAFMSCQPRSTLEPSESFYREVAERINELESASVSARIISAWRSLSVNWRVALSAGTFLLLALAALGLFRRHTSFSEQRNAASSLAALSASDPAPTLGNYKVLAGESLDDLSALLSRQGNKRLPPAPIYTASGVVIARTSF